MAEWEEVDGVQIQEVVDSVAHTTAALRLGQTIQINFHIKGCWNLANIVSYLLNIQVFQY